ncbi:MAG TPA: hypothetical protein VGG39_35260 [Polyangiaceae bacterium]
MRLGVLGALLTIGATFTFTLPAAGSPSGRGDVAARFAGDPEAARLALELFDTDGDIVDVLPAERFDGGYRGVVSLVPAVPAGADRKHLAWVSAALHDFDTFFAAITAKAPPRYRWRGLTLRFFRSVGNTTPNAFAQGWTIAYNVNGSIDTSADAARETLFHEIFHLDDADHGDWSPKGVGPIHDAIEKKCGTNTPCLTPFAPTSTIVRRGTFYSFQPGNDAHEYAAEVALRWYREQRAIVRGDKPVHPAFKCGPPENRRAWDAILAEFFGGVDLVPAC